MRHLTLALFALAALVFLVHATPFKRVPHGTWRVEFSNHVVQTVGIARSGATTVTEPLRRAKAAPVITSPTTIVFTYDDDRVERWTRVGTKFVVEHWYSAKNYPESPPEMGIAEKSR